MTYPPNAPTEFFRAARRNQTGSLVQLLKLPAEKRVVAALRDVIPEWSEEECSLSLRDGCSQAKRLADDYVDEEGVLRDAYNRVKHGATMLHDKSLKDGEFWVIGPNLAPSSDRDERRYLLPKFTVSRSALAGMVRQVQRAGEVIRYFAGLAHAMDKAGLLYPAGRLMP